MPLEIKDAFCGKQQLGMGEDDEIVGSRIFEHLESALEFLSFVRIEQTKQ
jgi:hypothetical protein